jgi:hypothetical protein
MAKLSVSVPHSVGQEEAVRRLQERSNLAANAYKGQVRDLKQEWQGNVLSYRFSVLGAAISGTVAVEPSEVRVIAEVPFTAMMFRGVIEKQLREELTRALA